MEQGFQRFVGIDWSGAASTGGQRVYVAEAHRAGGRITVHSVVRARDRAAVEAFLGGAELEPAASWADWPRPDPPHGRTRRLVGLDFAFGFPPGFQHPRAGADWTWEQLGEWADSLAPSGDASALPVRKAIEADPALAAQFVLGAGDRAPEGSLRTTDLVLNGGRPESVFHLIGPSQVGIGSITGIAMLHRLRARDPGFAVWPLDPPARSSSARVVAVEAWPRMWLGRGVRKNELPERVEAVDRWAHQGVFFRTQAEQAALSSGDALDAVAAALGAARAADGLPAIRELPGEVRREGWIAGAEAP